MICISLIMALELVASSSDAAPAVTAAQIELTNSINADLRREIAALSGGASIAAEELAQLPTLDEAALQRAAEETEAAVERLQRELQEARDRQRAGDKRLADRTEQDDAERKEVQQTIEEIQDEIKALRIQLEELAKGDRIFFRPGAAHQTMWLAEITADRLRFARVGVSEPPREFSGIASREMEVWLRSLDRSANAFLLIVKPGGESWYERLRGRLLLVRDGSRFDVGVQVAATDDVVIDPRTGAGAP